VRRHSSSAHTPLGPDASGGFNPASIDLVYKNGRACPSGPATLGANFASGTTPQSLIDSKTGVSLIENVNFRPAGTGFRLA